ncbi:ACT domain-containing protein [Trujillonella endophytica]|uniref:ACT domain-containing protein n=1 Tax=Trujillonella endophytica TaxID=673521 RepID=A0A1H8TJ82_9ACTN|nr:ACT domain-containing protein [Trujillella endophytica]SEO90604.1 ACT domain-containing protein [Trujillella endophytica]
MSYLLRLVVPDRPGILGAVATALGAAGVDIISVDVLERGGGVAVDDIVIDLPPDRLPDGLITAAQAVDGVQVESLRPFAGPLDTHRELELLEALARAGEGTAVKLLAAELPRVFTSGWAAILTGGGDRCEVLATSDAAPTFDGMPVPWLPLEAPRLLPSEDEWMPERWREMAIEMMATPFGSPRTAVVIGRSGGPAFRRSELLRLVHLTGIAATVAHLPPA